MEKQNKEILSLGIVVFAFFMALAATFQFSSAKPIQPLDTENVTLPIMARYKNSIILPVDGNVYPRGYFNLTIAVGHPNPKSFTFEFDTGSDVTWIQCDTNVPCHGCTVSSDKRYKFKNNAILCNDPLKLCAAIQGDLHPILCHSPNEKCRFEVTYADGSTCRGTVVTDLFFLQSGEAHPPSLVFGCGNELTDPYHLQYSSKTSGILGLGHSPGSIVSQLHDQHIIKKNVIGHCLAYEGGGFLFFGDDYIPSGIVWTPMTHHSEHNPPTYTSGPAQLLFDQKLVVASGLELIFDSGSTYTYFNSPVYKSIFIQVAKNLGKDYKLDPGDKTLSVCIKGPKPFESVRDLQTAFKTFYLKFPEGNTLEIRPESYFIISHPGNACLGILDGGEVRLGNRNIIGDISMLNKMFVYDNDHKKIGWKDFNCRTPPLF